MSEVIDFKAAATRRGRNSDRGPRRILTPAEWDALPLDVRQYATEYADEHFPSCRSRVRKQGKGSMHTYMFRSYDLIVEADEADLARDVKCDLHKANVKLQQVRKRLQGIQEQAAAQIKMLTTAETKLSTAIEAAHAEQLASGIEPPPKTAAEKRREFKEAMRRRIREVARIRNLSREQINWPLTLRHRAIGEFMIEHGVCGEWLLEGRGRIFKDDPIEIGPNMTGAEFAEIVRTLPAAQQRTIEATVRQLAERQPE
jgi:hypothetical protein